LLYAKNGKYTLAFGKSAPAPGIVCSGRCATTASANAEARAASFHHGINGVPGLACVAVNCAVLAVYVPVNTDS